MLDVRQEVIEARQDHRHQQRGDGPAQPEQGRPERAAEEAGQRGRHQRQRRGRDEEGCPREGDQHGEAAGLPQRAAVVHVVRGVEGGDQRRHRARGRPHREHGARGGEPRGPPRAERLETIDDQIGRRPGYAPTDLLDQGGQRGRIDHQARERDGEEQEGKDGEEGGEGDRSSVVEQVVASDLAPQRAQEAPPGQVSTRHPHLRRRGQARGRTGNRRSPGVTAGREGGQ